MAKTRVKRSKSRLNKKTRRQRGGWPKWLSCLGGKCNNVTNPVAVSTNNPMRNTQRRPTGVRRPTGARSANNTTTTYNPLRGVPANMNMNMNMNMLKALQAEQAEQGVNFNAAMARAFPVMSDQQNINAEWAKPSAGQTQAERNAELAENNRKKQEATEWPNSPVATSPKTKRQPAKQAAAAAFNIGDQPSLNEARRDLPARWYADYDKNMRIVYYYQPTPRSAVTKQQYERPT